MHTPLLDRVCVLAFATTAAPSARAVTLSFPDLFADEPTGSIRRKTVMLQADDDVSIEVPEGYTAYSIEAGVTDECDITKADKLQDACARRAGRPVCRINLERAEPPPGEAESDEPYSLGVIAAVGLTASASRLR